MANVLVVEDEPKLRRLICEALESEGHRIGQACSARQALVELAANIFQVVITDLRLPEGDGMRILESARKALTPAEVIVITAHGTTDNAVAAMKAGAADYLTKPFALDELRLRVRRLVEQQATKARAEGLAARLIPELVAVSEPMQKVLAAARQVAPADVAVLLTGESGTGKSQLARYIHYHSKRAAGPLVQIHCAALPETLLESELFGHEKGAFTGAIEKKQGHLAAADSGTVFLDEIGEVTLATQVKLLRFLQDHELVPVGSTQPRTVDVRVIAATNRDLDEAVKTGSFRQDFLYRLNVFTLRVPPLRERRTDIVPLVERWLGRRGLPPLKLSGAAKEALLRHRWPGNVRELENVLERAVILSADGQISAEQLALPAGSASRRAADVLTEGFDLDEFERDLLYAALERTGGNKTAAAKLLGITRRRMYSRLESLGHQRDDDADS